MASFPCSIRPSHPQKPRIDVLIQTQGRNLGHAEPTFFSCPQDSARHATIAPQGHRIRTALPSSHRAQCQHQISRESSSNQQRHQGKKDPAASRLTHTEDITGTALHSPLALASARLSPEGEHTQGPTRRSTACRCASVGVATQESAGVLGANQGARKREKEGGSVEEEGEWRGNEQQRGGERPLWSVIIPTYNRLPILCKCLAALEAQELVGEEGIPVLDFEVVVVDDGSSDATVDFLTQQGPREFPHARLLCQEHGGAAVARNLGVQSARGSVLVFIDSDLVVSPQFLAAHWRRLGHAQERWGDERSFSYGRVVNTSNFEDPQSEPFKLTDLSAAFFATGNVAIARSMLQEAAHLLKPLEPPPSTPGVPLATPPSTQSANLHAAAQPMNPSPPGDVDHRAGAEAGAGAEAVAEASSPTERSAPADGTLAPGHGPGSTRDGNGGVRSEGVPAWVGPGPFDPEFRTYGWEDLELGERLRMCGARIVQCPEAVGFHWHTAFSLDQLEGDLRRERERGRNAVRFFLKHPASWHVRLMLQLTPFHWFLWGLLTLGGLVSEASLRPLLQTLVAKGHIQVAGALLVPVYNWHYMLAMDKELERLRAKG